MAKKKSKEKKKQIDLVYTEVEVPGPQELLLKDTHIRGEGDDKKTVFVIRFNAQTVEMAQRYTDSLIVSRGLPATANDLPSMSDPVCLYISQTMDYVEPGDEPIVARNFYQRQHQQATRDGLFIAMCDHNDFDDGFQARPYDEDDEDVQEMPNWLMKAEAQVVIPEPERKLNNPYEYRLKQLMDFTEECGVMFAASFKAKMDASMSTVLRTIGEETDQDGFRKEPSSPKVHVPTGS